MKGVEHYKTKSGLQGIRVHYTADPNKDPDTPEGAEWMEIALRGYRGGVQSSAWREEMEIDWDATGGELVFPELDQYSGKVFIDDFKIPDDWNFFAAYDYGRRNPFSFHVHVKDFDENVYTVYELYGSEVGYRDQARLIRACPYFEKLSFFPIADPSIFALTQEKEEEVKSIALLFAELPESERVIFVPGSRGGDVTVAERIKGDLWTNLATMEPRWKIFKSCRWLKWELCKLRWADWSDTQMAVRNQREKIIDKDNHAWDDAKMFFNMFLFGPTKAPEDALDKLRKIDPLSWGEWKAMRERLDTPHNSAGMGDFDI